MKQMKVAPEPVMLSAEQAWEQFGDLAAECFLRDVRVELSTNLRRYELLGHEENKPVLASKLAQTIVANRRSTIMCVTHWWEDTAAFEEYRHSLGENRPLIEAPIHILSSDHCAEMERLLLFVLELEWDCFIFDKDFSFLLETNHDGYLNITGVHPDSLQKIATEFAGSTS